MQQTGAGLSSFPRYSVEFIDIPTIQSDTEVRPNKTADDYGEKPFYGHGRILPFRPAYPDFGPVEQDGRVLGRRRY